MELLRSMQFSINWQLESQILKQYDTYEMKIKTFCATIATAKWN